MVAISQSIAFAVLLWITLSTTVIVFNASLLQKFRHPITLICWHMLVGSFLTLAIRLVKPELLRTGDEARGVPALTLQRAVKLGTPIAVFHATSMIAGNTAYLFLSVSFIQMVKAWTSGVVYLAGCVMGTQTWSVPVAKTIGATTLGLTIATYGELDFNMFGFCLQVVSILLEGVRINLLELCLKSNGYKLNPLSSLQIFAPIMFCLLVPCVAVWDGDAVSVEAISQVGGPAFIVNGLCAFCLNLATYLVIQTASGLILALGGVLKDSMIIFGSAVFMGTSVTGTQIFGYLIALAGLQAYGQVSKDPAAFEDAGVMPVLWQRLQAYVGPGEKKRLPDNEELPAGEPEMMVESQRIGQSWSDGLDEDEV